MSVDKYDSVKKIFQKYGKTGINIDQCMQVFEYIDNYIDLDRKIKDKLFADIQEVGKKMKKQKPLQLYQTIVYEFMMQTIEDENYYRHGVNVIATLANKFFADTDKLHDKDEDDDVVIIDEKENEKGINVGKQEEPKKKKKSKASESEEKSGSQGKKKGKKADSKEGSDAFSGNLFNVLPTKGKSKSKEDVIDEVNEDIEEALHKEAEDMKVEEIYLKVGTMYVIEDKPNKKVEELMKEAADEWKRYRNTEIYLYLIDRYLNSIMRNEVIHGIYMLVYFAKKNGADYHFVVKNILRTVKIVNIKSILDVFKNVTTNEEILNDTIKFLKTYVELEDYSLEKERMYNRIFPTNRPPKQKQQIQTIDKLLLKKGEEYTEFEDHTRYYRGGYRRPFRTVPYTSDEIKNVLENLKK